MTFIIAGVCGNIGTSLALTLLKNEFNHVLGLDNFISGSRKNLPLLTKFPNFTFLEHDICSKLPRLEVRSIDWIMHFASPASPDKYRDNPLETIGANTTGTTNLLELAKASGAKFLFASTSEVYGDPLVHPQTELYNGNVNPYSSRSVYDESKRLGETLVCLYHDKFNVSTRTIRIFNTYGPYIDNSDGRVIANFIDQAIQNKPITIYGNGLQTRSFQYVDDLISAIMKLIETDYRYPINIGNPEETTMLKLAETVKRITNSKSNFTFKELPSGDPSRRKPDISLAKGILNWEPKVTLENGIKLMVNHHLLL